MDDRSHDPFNGPMGELRDGGDLSPGSTVVPWIDNHTHGHTQAWRDRESWELTGCHAIVFLPVGHHQPYRPASPEHYRLLWDDVVKKCHQLSRSHFFEVYAGLGVHVQARVEGYERLVDALPGYADLDRVVAVGETGIDAMPRDGAGGDRWSLDEQREVVADQMRVARETGLPILCHTPSHRRRRSSDSFHAATGRRDDVAEPLLDPGTAKLEATRILVELADETGLSHEQVVINHAHPSMVSYAMEESGCHVSFTVGAPTMRGTTGEEVAGAIREYGPDRVMVDTDESSYQPIRPMSMKRTILDLLRRGIDEADVRRVVYDNPREVLGLDDLPP